MAHLYEIDGIVPVVHPTAFISGSATLIGDVIVGENCYVGPSACLRGDFGRLRLMAGCNVQDCAVVHGGAESETIVGEGAIVSHGAVVHGCTIGEGALVGINAVVLDGATVGAFAFVAAMSLVTAGFLVPPRTLVRGVPAESVREINAAEWEFLIKGSEAYKRLAVRSRLGRRVTEPLRQLTMSRDISRIPPQ